MKIGFPNLYSILLHRIQTNLFAIVFELLLFHLELLISSQVTQQGMNFTQLFRFTSTGIHL